MRLRIKEVRKAHRKTLDDLADAMGKSRATVHRYETGKVNITLNDLAKIADRLGVPMTELWQEDATEEEIVHA